MVPSICTMILAALSSGAVGFDGEVFALDDSGVLDQLVGANVELAVADHPRTPGTRGLRVREIVQGAGNSMAVLPTADFTDGVIELELSAVPRPDAPASIRGFVGVAFRVQEAETWKYECLYLRMTNGRAEEQIRRNHATQYVSHPAYPWYRLRSEAPGQYESYVDLAPGEWTRVRIEVEGRTARLYVHDAEQPALVVGAMLGEVEAGAVALWIGHGTEAFFRNVRISHGPVAARPVAPLATEDKVGIPWPTNGWQEHPPGAASSVTGVDGEVLRAIDAEIEAGDFGLVDSMLVIREGRVVIDRHYPHDYRALTAGRDMTPHQFNYDHPDWHPFFQGTKLHTMQSVTKSFTSTLIGAAIHRGEIKGTDVPALSFFPERSFEDPDGRKALMTIEDVLTMRSGFAWDEWTAPLDDARNDCSQLEASEDWIGYVLDKPLATDPGSTFVYNSGSTHLLSGILRAATGMTIEEYAVKHLFGPLGIEAFHWKTSPRALPDTEGGLYLKPRDLAKLGFLFLHDGQWEGQRILPEGWVERAVTPWVEDIAPNNGRPDPGYGYKWWILDDGAGATPKVYAAMGYGGQFLLVAPDLDLIAVFTGWNIHQNKPSPTNLFLSRIVPACQ